MNSDQIAVHTAPADYEWGAGQMGRNMAGKEHMKSTNNLERLLAMLVTDDDLRKLDDAHLGSLSHGRKRS